MRRLYILQTLFYLIFFGLSISPVFAQNLVVNPSFENTNTNCANFGGESFRADLDPTWDNANSNVPGDSCSSPDLFSDCNLFAVGMPSSILGWQYARTGTRYSGIILYEAPFGMTSNYREYIQGHTTSPLVAGETYCVSFYISLADDVQYASENIGVYFSNTQYQRDACANALINETPQLTNNCGVLMDTANWVRLEWEYTAQGGEQYFVIGNFQDQNNTPLHNAYGGSMNPYAYYFIEDVSIIEGSCCYAEIDPVSSPCVNDAAFDLTASEGSGCSGPGTPAVGTWAGPGITDPSTGNFDPNIAGTGTHTITFTLNCGYEATIDITVKGCSLEVCEDDNGDYVVSGGTGPYIWSEWTSGSTTQVTDETSCLECGGTWNFGQCMSSGFPPTPITSCPNPPGYEEYATGGSVSPSTNFPLIVVDDTGDTLTINDASEISDCSNCPTIDITISNQTDASCAGADGTATVSASGGAGPYTYNWQPGNLSGDTQTGLSAGTYTVTATDDNNCTGDIDVTIANTGNISLTIDNIQNISCNGDSDGSATVNVSGGQSPFSYDWDNGETTATASSLAAGNHIVTVTDDNGCTADETVSITEPDAIIITIDDTTNASCGNSDGAATVSAVGGTGNLQYQWNDPSNQNGVSASNLAAGVYEVTVTDDNGCTNTQEVIINNSNGPTASFDNVTHVSCFGNSDGSATVNASGGQSPYTYSWSPSGGTSQTATNLSAGDYNVTVTDDGGCIVTATITITEPDPMIANATINNADCGDDNGSISLNINGGTPNYTYSWSNGETTGSISDLSPGDYTVTITDGTNCTMDTTFTIELLNGLDIDAQPEQSIIGTDQSVGITVAVAGNPDNYTYSWSPTNGLSCSDCPNPTATPSVSTTYIVTVTDTTNGCMGTDTVFVQVNDPCAEVYVPNIFSPNIDGMNDSFCIKGACIREYYLQIFNRWGQTVFESKSIHDCWDGRFKDKKLNTGVFVYKLHIITLDGEVIDKSGNIDLVR